MARAEKEAQAQAEGDGLVLRVYERATSGRPEMRSVLTLTRKGKKTVKDTGWLKTSVFYVEHVLLHREYINYVTKGVGRPVIG